MTCKCYQSGSSQDWPESNTYARGGLLGKACDIRGEHAHAKSERDGIHIDNWRYL